MALIKSKFDLFLTSLSISLILSITSFAGGDRTPLPPQEASITIKKTRPDDIEIIEGVPQDRKFEKLQPIWVTAYSINATLKKAKREAAKLGANAIIEFKVGSGSQAVALNGFYSQVNRPIIQGWAIKWLDH